MPFTVTAWPYYPDPRLPDFSLIGYAFGQVPPDRFLLSTTDALPPYDYLNDGIVLPVIADVPGKTDYGNLAVGIQLSKSGFSDVVPLPQPHSVLWTLDIMTPASPLYTGQLFLIFPPAIQPFSISVSTLGDPDDLIPNPVLIQPRNFSVEP